MSEEFPKITKSYITFDQEERFCDFDDVEAIKEMYSNLQSQLKESLARESLFIAVIQDCSELLQSIGTEETKAKVKEVFDLALSQASPRAKAMLKVVEAARRAEQACLCKREDQGPFDYGEEHPRKGKAKGGSCWLLPRELLEPALQELDGIGQKNG